MATNVYIDGFNLYYGSLKDRWPEYKWLNLESFCGSLLPSHDIKRIRYFTALVNDRPSGENRRQRTYLRALATLPKIEIHYGRFTSHEVRMPLVSPEPGGPATVLVRRTDEKGTDANLTAFLLADCCEGDFDEAVVISNDSDFATPVEMVRERFHKRIGVISPHPTTEHISRLQQAAAWSYRTIYKRYFRGNQLPQRITDANGTFEKPPGM